VTRPSHQHTFAGQGLNWNVSSCVHEDVDGR
jgi:hypothetical protein